MTGIRIVITDNNNRTHIDTRVPAGYMAVIAAVLDLLAQLAGPGEQP